METRLREVLQGQEGNYIVPFFWQHGESEETLREYMGKIEESGIRAVCVESRPHPDYVGDGWWRDMDVILEEAAARKMRVWVLDDAHFPTGYCNGQIASHPEYGKVFLDHYIVDVMGPDAYASFLIRLEEGEELVGVVAVRRDLPGEQGTIQGKENFAREEAATVRGKAGSAEDESGNIWDKAEVLDISSCVNGGMAYWPVPEGYWRVVVLKTVREGKNCRKDYCNLLDRDAVAFFLETVYEPHWQHYREKFGNVFAGFFSDEPEFGNTFGEYPHSGIGQPTMLLPWCRELAACCQNTWGEEKNLYLAALWINLEGYAQKARYEYMSMATDLYSRNFCMQVGKWCEDHGVEYIGHVVEDNGNHARTGYGTGHFFKALWGQHMSGIDVVLQQIRPGFDDMDFCHIGGKNTYDGRFFHYGLGKMGSSLARLDGKKKGRTMCEVYGAYGWTEGLKLMKWLADHMLVRGVNWFVPHAFTPAPFPDPDCPPHFYAQGQNPQFSWFKDLMGYMNRMCHLLNGGESMPRTAVLYTAEMGWMGEHMPFEEVGKWLMRSQIDFDVVPLWLLGESRFAGETMITDEDEAYVPGTDRRSVCGFTAGGSAEETRQTDTDGGSSGTRLCVGNASYSVLIVPDCAYIPGELARWVKQAKQAGFPVVFLGKRPQAVGTEEMVLEWQQDGEKAGEGEMSVETEEALDGEKTAREAMSEEKEAGEGTSGKEIPKKGASGKETLEKEEAGKTRGTVFCQGSRERLMRYLEERNVREVVTASLEPWLRYRQYSQPGGTLYLFFNEHPTEPIDTWVEIKRLATDPKEEICWYDGWDNCLYDTEQKENGNIRLTLSPYETKVLYLGNLEEGMEPAGRLLCTEGRCLELAGEWQVSYKAYDQDGFGSATVQNMLENVTAPGQKPEFSGTVRYQTSFLWDPETDGETATLDCGQVFETLEVRLNQKLQAVRVAPPYVLPLKGLQKGCNELELLVTNTLVHKMRDFLSMTMPVEASGLLGPVRLVYGGQESQSKTSPQAVRHQT